MLYAFARQNVPCVGFNVRRATRLVTQFYDRALAPAGLRSTQFSLLNVLAMVPALRMQDLADILAMDRTTLTRNLKPLLKQGWVKTTVGADRRARMVQITPGGRNVMHGAQPMWEEAQKYITERLGADTWDGVMEDLHRLSMIVEDASVDEAG
ncbi:MAG: winged helix-turn-helix transcriptional regulator [Anaerolineae bacterium]|nr:winged helix-turn-helix transcriptional regulator [Anaerolineae bacterium]